MKLRRILLVLLAFGAALTFGFNVTITDLTQKKVDIKDANVIAKQYYEFLYGGNIEGSFDMLDKLSVEIGNVTREQFITQHKGLSETKSQLNDIIIDDTAVFGNNTVQVKVTLKIANSGTATEEKSYLFLKAVEGQWKVLYRGISDKIVFEGQTLTKGGLSIFPVNAIITPLDISVEVYARNETKNDIRFGSNKNKCILILETDTGSFTTDANGTLLSGKDMSGVFKFSSANGDIKKISITNITELKNENQEENTIRDIVIYEKK